MRAPWLLVIAAGLLGCRADVSGRWMGHVGDEPAEMALEQEGALVTGRLCRGDRCAEAYGDIVETNLELDYGCGSCDLPATLLDLDLRGPDLSGDAQLDPCLCEEAGCCHLPARFTRAR